MSPPRHASREAHTEQCERIAQLLRRRYPAHRVVDEHTLRAEESIHGGALASATLGQTPHGRPRLHRPDIVVWPPPELEGELPVAVEVELTLKSPKRLVAICKAWAACRAVDCVIYVAAPAVYGPLCRAVQRAGAGERIVVLPLATL